MIAAAVTLSTMIAASPTCSVVVTQRVGLDANKGLEIAELLSQALSNQGSLGAQCISPRTYAARIAATKTLDPVQCGGVADCVAEFGRIGKLDWVFSLQVSKVARELIVDLTLIRVRDATAVLTIGARIPSQQPASSLESLARDVARRAPSLDVAAPQPSPTAPSGGAATDMAPPPLVTAAAPEPSPREEAAASGAVAQTNGQAPSRTGALVGVLAISELLGHTLGAEAFGGYRVARWDFTGRLRLGSHIGVGVAADYGVDWDRFTVLLGARFDAYLFNSSGVGGFVGARVALGTGIGFNVGLSVEALQPSVPGYRTVAVVASGGLDWRR